VELIVCSKFSRSCDDNVVKVMYAVHILFTVDNRAFRKYFLCLCLSGYSGWKRIIFHLVREERMGPFLVM
jgi:hypothetical protein